ncbi:hypothetical protein [Streptomyces sp. DT18]
MSAPTPEPLTPDAALVRLRQYGERTSTWSTATYNDGTERALADIARTLSAEVTRLRAALSAAADDVNELTDEIADWSAKNAALRAERAEAQRQVAELTNANDDAVRLSEYHVNRIFAAMNAGSALYAALTMPTTEQQRQDALDQFTAVAHRTAETSEPTPLRAELAARPSRAEVLREALAAAEAEHLEDETGMADDRAYTQGVTDAANAIRALLNGEPRIPLVVDRFDVAIEPAPEEEPVLTIGCIAEDGRPVALLLDPETRRKVAGWLAPQRKRPPAARLHAERNGGAV